MSISMSSSLPLYATPPVFADDRDPEEQYGIVLLFVDRNKRCGQAIVRYLDPQSVMKLRIVTKEINREGEQAMYRVWRYLVAANLSSSSIMLPNVGGGGGEGQMSFTRAVYEVFFANKRQEVLIMGGEIEGEATNEVTKMTIEQDGTIRFEASAPMLHARNVFDAVYHQGEVLAIGSGYGDEAEQTVERFCTLTQTQTKLQTDMPEELERVCAAMLDNKLYVVSKSRDVYTLEEHASHAAQGVWQKHDALAVERRSWPVAIAFEGKLYICGGDGLKTVESFDPVAGTWQREDEEMTKERFSFSLFVFEGELYAIGGDDNGQNTTIEKRNKDTKKWELVADCGQIRSFCASTLVGSKVLLFGGGDHHSTFDFFDLHTKKWASQDVGGAYFDESKAGQVAESVSKRQMPRPVYMSRAVLITPSAAKTKAWTDLNVVKLEEREKAHLDERFEAITGKAITIPSA